MAGTGFHAYLAGKEAYECNGEAEAMAGRRNEQVFRMDWKEVEIMAKEKWKKVSGWESYKVSDLGKVMNKKGYIMKPFRNGVGKVLSIKLSENGFYMVSGLCRIVADNFLEAPDNYGNMKVGFKDGNPDNCKASNLEWVQIVRPPLPKLQKGAQIALKHGKYVGQAAMRKERTLRQKMETMLKRGYKRVTVVKRLGVHPALVDQVAIELAEKILKEQNRGIE